MSEMVQRVAKALREQLYGLDPGVSRRMAKAAITAMREPTREMQAATEGNGAYLDYQAMIDEARK